MVAKFGFDTAENDPPKKLLEQSCAAAVKEFDERQKQARATRATLHFSDAYFAKFGLTS